TLAGGDADGVHPVSFGRVFKLVEAERSSTAADDDFLADIGHQLDATLEFGAGHSNAINLYAASLKRDIASRHQLVVFGHGHAGLHGMGVNPVSKRIEDFALAELNLAELNLDAIDGELKALTGTQAQRPGLHRIG